jgi:hypothetical protein
MEEVRDRSGAQASMLAAKQMVNITAARTREQESYIFKYTTVPPFFLFRGLCLLMSVIDLSFLAHGSVLAVITPQMPQLLPH